MDVIWNGLKIFSQIGGPATIQTKTFQVTGINGNNNLSFVGTANSDTYGMIIDDVILRRNVVDCQASIRPPNCAAFSNVCTACN